MKQKLTVRQRVKKIPNFYEPECSLPYSQQTATCPIPSQMNPVRACSFHLFKVHLNITLPSTSTSSICSISSFFPHTKPECIYYFKHACRISSPSHSPRVDQIRKLKSVHVTKQQICNDDSDPIHYPHRSNSTLLQQCGITAVMLQQLRSPYILVRVDSGLHSDAVGPPGKLTTVVTL